jgi:TonB family protein
MAYERSIEVGERDQLLHVALSKPPEESTPSAEEPDEDKSVSKPPVAASAQEMHKKRGGKPLVVGGMKPNRDRIRVLICIDESGKVTSASVISSVPRKWRAGVVEAVKTWTFEPYTEKGEPTPACFEDYPKFRSAR